MPSGAWRRGQEKAATDDLALARRLCTFPRAPEGGQPFSRGSTGVSDVLIG